MDEKEAEARPEMGTTFVVVDILKYLYWASEASPTLGCSIEISRDIYMSVCRYVCRMSNYLCSRNYVAHMHAQSHFCSVKTDL